MRKIQNQEEKMRTIFEIAQKMKSKKIKTAKSFDGVEDFIDTMKSD